MKRVWESVHSLDIDVLKGLPDIYSVVQLQFDSGDMHGILRAKVAVPNPENPAKRSKPCYYNSDLFSIHCIRVSGDICE